MKRILITSVVANLVLGALVFLLAHSKWKTREAVDLPSTSAGASPTETYPGAVTNANQSPEAATNQFRWAQLESTNYRIYAANLRRVGCPEQTIRDVIAADVHSIYAPKFHELETKKSALSATRLPDQIASQSVETELDQLRGEEAAVVAAALSQEEQGVAISGPQRSSRSRVQEMTVSMPLVLQEVKEQSIKLDAQQREIIADLRAKFQQDIGGPNQDPDDPAYRERWRKAQRDSDDMLAGMLGGQFFVEYQLHAGERSPQSQ